MNDNDVIAINAAEIRPPRRSLWKVTGIGIVLLGIISFTLLLFLNTPPDNFPTNSVFTVKEGSSIRTIGETLYTQGFVRSIVVFRLLTHSKSEPIMIRAGSYTFSKPLSSKEIISALAEGTSAAPPRSITFPEGFSVYDMRAYVGDAILDINIEHALTYEGYLFPETYFISPEESFDELVARMRNEYEKKMEPLRERIDASGFTEKEVIILASIIEREANDEASMRMVSGILQNRLQNNLPLQVDAVFTYLLGKTSAELTMDDLMLDSPYNTYTNIGLPPTPIANPGLMAINAVLDPLPSEYLFYLTGNDGSFYYAKDFEEHKRNKAHHLRS